MPVNNNFHKGILFAAFTAFIWGFQAIVLKLALKGLNPIDVTWFRFAVAFFILFIYFLFTRPMVLKILIHPPLLLFIAACFLGLNYLGFITGIDKTTPSIAQVFIQTGTVLLAVTGFIIFKEKVTFRQILGLMLVICGLTIFYHNQIITLVTDIGRYRQGVLWTLFGAVSWSCYAVIQKKLVVKFHPIHLNLFLFALPFLFYSPFVNYQSFINIPFSQWIPLSLTGINTALAYGTLAFAFKYLEANKVSVIIMLNPIITFITMAILGIMEVNWIVKENFTYVSVLGSMCVIAGAVLTVIRKKL